MEVIVVKATCVLHNFLTKTGEIIDKPFVNLDIEIEADGLVDMSASADIMLLILLNQYGTIPFLKEW